MIYSRFRTVAMVAMLMTFLAWTAGAAYAQIEAASTSKLMALSLPASAQRLTDPGMVAKIEPQLQVLAENAHCKMVNPEVLIWMAGDVTVRQQLESTAKAAGYTYQEKDAPDQGDSKVTGVVLTKSGNVYGGFWIASDGMLMLAWGQLEPKDGGTKPTAKSDDDPLNKVSSSPIPDRSKKVLAQGNPPLTREMSDSYLDTLAFMAQAVSGKTISFDVKVKDGFANALAKKYSQMTAAQQTAFSQLPAYLAQVKTAWPTLSEDDKNTLRRQWSAQLKAMIPKTPQQVAYEKAMAKLDHYNTLAGQRALTPSEKLDVAKTLDTCAAEMRREGGDQNLQQAAQYEKLAEDFRTGAKQTAQNSAPQRHGSQKAYEEALRQMEDSHNAYMFMSNMNTMNYAASMNAISTMGGGGYTYEVH